MRILFVGDVIGRPGRDRAAKRAASFASGSGSIFVVANGENAAGGFGITRATANELFDTGVGCPDQRQSLARQREILTFIDSEERILRPRNYPAGTPGRGANLYHSATVCACW
jgi:calcineurin-like phosphoesterase